MDCSMIARGWIRALRDRVRAAPRIGRRKRLPHLPADVSLNLDKAIQVGSSAGDHSELGRARGRRGARTIDKRMVQQVEGVQAHLECQAFADFDVLAEAGIPLLVAGAAEPVDVVREGAHLIGAGREGTSLLPSLLASLVGGAGEDYGCLLYTSPSPR